MGICADTLKNFIDGYSVSQALSNKSELPMEINAQQTRESQLLGHMTNPRTDQKIQTIQELNDAIQFIDQLYHFQSFLPGGAVEQTLSNKYDLTKRVGFSDAELKNLMNHFHNKAQEAVNLLIQSDPTFEQRALQKANSVVMEVLAVMGAITISDGSLLTLFIQPSEVNKLSNSNEGGVKDIYTKLFDGETQNICHIDFRQAKKMSFGKNNGQLVIEFNPDFKNVKKSFGPLYKYAEEQGLLEAGWQNITSNNNKKSPMEVEPEEWKQDVKNAVYQNLTLPIDANGKQFLTNEELDFLFQKYNVETEIALGRSLSNLRGFTGELRAILISNILFGGEGVSATGKATVQLENAARGGQEAPIDVRILLDNLGEIFGFQVKNIQDLESYTWSNSEAMSIDSFYANRLQMPNVDGNFFGAYAYHKPIKNTTEAYQNAYDGFKAKFNSDFVPIYKKLALYIIRQSTVIKKSKNDFFGDKGLVTLTNDFFFMNNKVVPASAIMKNLIKNENIKSSFTLQPAAGESHYDSHKKLSELFLSNYSNYSNYAKITYSVTLNYSAILTSAYNGT